MELPYGTETIVIGGCVRIDPKEGIYLHHNSVHAAVGVKSVSIDREYLRMDFTNSAPVVSATVTADETVGGFYGMIVGASGGVDKVMIRFFDTKLGRRLDMSDKDDYARVASSMSNIWVNVVHVKR